ncbi:SET-binding protein-like [Brienomyrus brachyistius]|uniref:SET-binding protein-like n=1 Tax=Brienomyrus brachyistius TaxID=42636 RepID=UPI0020B42C92|nr:SET-binding protein-like [Brienomyrus brachyistius]
MEQRELTSSARLKEGEADMHSSRSDLPKNLGGPLHTIESGLSMAGKNVQFKEGVEFRGSNLDSGKWSQDGLEEQEFSIKEANFSEGSLKMKIQTTKRAKKPPKSLENYICPPEIRITIKQSGEHKMAKQCKSGKVAKEEEKIHKKMVDLKKLNQNTRDPQLDSAKSQASSGPSPENRTGVGPTGEMTNVAHNILPDLINTHTKSQQKKVASNPSSGFCVTGSPCQIIPSFIPTSPPRKEAQKTEHSLMRLAPDKKDKGLREVSAQVFGNIKRKYERKVSSYNFDVVEGKMAKSISEDSVKERRINESDNSELSSGDRECNEKSKMLSVYAPVQADESKGHAGRRRQYQQSVKDAVFSEDLREEPPELAKKRDKESKVPNKIESWAAKVADNHKPETKMAGPVSGMVNTSKIRLRKNGMGRSNARTASDEQRDKKSLKLQTEEMSCTKLKESSHQNAPELPSAYPITPSSPLYTNVGSLTVIAPVKKSRGRPKKQPLLTVETIHEETSDSPVNPVTKETSHTQKKRRRKQSLAKFVKMGHDSLSHTHQVKEMKANKVTKINKSTSNKTKTVEMKRILNEILSCHKNNLFLKSMAPTSNTVSTVASTIEARLGKQINISKRGTIYIGKKRGRKPRPGVQVQSDQDKMRNKQLSSYSFENITVPSKPWSLVHISPKAIQLNSAQTVGASGTGCTPHLFNQGTNTQEPRTMPNLQAVSGLPMKTPKTSNWKRSPPQLMTNSPSHLSEVVSLKEVTLSPVSESHSEETIPSDSGIGTDNNSTSDQAEKGSVSRRRYSFDFCSLEPSEVVAADSANKSRRGHWHNRNGTAPSIETPLSPDNLKKQKHWRKRKGVQRHNDLQFLVDLEELISKFQMFHISHHSYRLYCENLYPSTYQIHYDQYYPVPCFPYDQLHQFRKNLEMKSKKRRGKPGKTDELITKTPFIHGFGYPFPSSNFYAPYTMPYTSMPVATTMMNLGYYGQYPAPLYIPHTFGTTTPPFSRPVVPGSQFHSGAHLKFTPGTKHRFGTHQLPITKMDHVQPLLMVPKGGADTLPNVRHHKRKHKHKHKHNENQLSSCHNEDLGGLYRRTMKPTFLSHISKRLRVLENEHNDPKQKDKQQNPETTHTLQRSSQNIFQANTLYKSSLPQSKQWKLLQQPGQPMHEIQSVSKCRHTDSIQSRQDFSSDLFQRLQFSREGIINKKQSLESQGLYAEQSPLFRNGQRERTQLPLPLLEEAHSPPMKKTFKRKRHEEIHCSMRNACKILSTKKNLDHVNKILKAKRLQRQAKTGNNIVKKRRGRPRKQPLLADEEPMRQMPVLEKCVDLPGKKCLLQQPEFFSQDTIDSVVRTGRLKIQPQPSQPEKPWEQVQAKRLRWCQGSEKEVSFSTGKKRANICSLPSGHLSLHFTP